MNVQRGKTGHGAIAMECNTCHGQENLPAGYGLNVPPGAHNRDDKLVGWGWMRGRPAPASPVVAGIAPAAT